MIEATEMRIIRAPLDRVVAMYLDWARWPEVFPATIRSTRLLEDRGEVKRIEIDHRQEGWVENVLTVVSSEEIRLEEWKRRFDASFTNHFERVPEGTRYRIDGQIRLKGAPRLLALLLRPVLRRIVGRRMRGYVLEPMAAAAERVPVAA